jgi:rusticyanin
MTATITPPTINPAPPEQKAKGRALVGGIAVAVATAALGIGLFLSHVVSSSPSGSISTPAYGYYQSMMGRFGVGSMMGGQYSSMMGQYGFTWMMGGLSAPQWMHGQNLPSAMMGSSADPGRVMGRLFANQPGPRVSAAEAARLGNLVPSGATVFHAAKTITFSGQIVSLPVVASPSGGPDETYRVAGMVNPTIIVPRGARVTLTIVNADPDTAHGLVVTSPGAGTSWMPMMTARPAFSGSALWFLGNPTSAGMHEGTVTFTATLGGTYQYLCPVPGHAQKGIVGSFVVSG